MKGRIPDRTVRARRIDDGPDRASFEQLPKFLEVLPTLPRDEETEIKPDCYETGMRMKLTNGSQIVMPVGCKNLIG
jgi:hypothetical protein